MNTARNFGVSLTLVIVVTNFFLMVFGNTGCANKVYYATGIKTFSSGDRVFAVEVERNQNGEEIVIEGFSTSIKKWIEGVAYHYVPNKFRIREVPFEQLPVKGLAMAVGGFPDLYLGVLVRALAHFTPLEVAKILPNSLDLLTLQQRKTIDPDLLADLDKYFAKDKKNVTLRSP